MESRIGAASGAADVSPRLGAAAQSIPRCDENTSFFSGREFVDAWSRSFPGRYQPLAIPILGSGPSRTMYAIQSPMRYWLRRLPLVRSDFFLSPGWVGQLDRSTMERILAVLMGIRTRSFVWNVRFDHEPLATGLDSFGLAAERVSTQVVSLSDGYDRVFAGYNATIRNQIRAARRRGVTVRQTADPADVRHYHLLYERVATKKGWVTRYPVELSLELIKLTEATRFFVAEYANSIVGGGLFVRDGSSVTHYFHCVQDDAHKNLFPSCAVIDQGIRWACESGATIFNLGTSGGVASLEEFKSHWGAKKVLNWTFEWTSPVWNRLGNVKSALMKGFDVFRYK